MGGLVHISDASDCQTLTSVVPPQIVAQDALIIPRKGAVSEFPPVEIYSSLMSGYISSYRILLHSDCNGFIQIAQFCKREVASCLIHGGSV
jgi:hypothetical protein